MNIPNEGSGNRDWAPAPGGISAYFPIGLQQTDLYTDDLNGNTRGLPVCTVGGVRAPFSSCEYPPISQVLGYCPALRFDGNSARDPVGQEMNSGFQSQYFPGYTPGTIDTARINPTCPTATENLYGPFGISFSLTLLSFCELIGVIDDDSVDLTLFLPTNEAWLKATSTAVPPISPNALFSAPYNAWICDLVKYHAVPEKIQYFGDLPDGSSLPTLAGENFDLFVRSQGLERKINQSLVQFLSLESSNTVVYRVDYPLNPQTGPAYFPDYPGSTDGQPSVTP